MKQTLLLDTNVFLRFFIGDVKSHFEKSKKVFEQIEKEEIPAKVSILVINELIWVLENFYNLKRKDFLPKIMSLLALRKIKTVEVKKDLIMEILKHLEISGFDFTDIYLFKTRAQDKVFTFDKALHKLVNKSQV